MKYVLNECARSNLITGNSKEKNDDDALDYKGKQDKSKQKGKNVLIVLIN